MSFQLMSAADLAQVIVPTNPEDLKKIKAALTQISDTMTIIEGHRGVISDDLKSISETYDLPAKFVRKMARAYHTQTFKKEVQEMEDFQVLYEQVMGEKASD